MWLFWVSEFIRPPGRLPQSLSGSASSLLFTHRNGSSLSSVIAVRLVQDLTFNKQVGWDVNVGNVALKITFLTIVPSDEKF